MASGKSTYLCNKLLDNTLGATSYTVPGTVYLALFTVTPNAGGTGGTECTGGSYARLAVTNNTTNFPNASAASKSNGTALQFVTATASWGTVVGVAIYDASTSGNMMYFADLTTSKAIGTNDTAKFNIGDLVFNES